MHRKMEDRIGKDLIESIYEETGFDPASSDPAACRGHALGSADPPARRLHIAEGAPGMQRPFAAPPRSTSCSRSSITSRNG